MMDKSEIFDVLRGNILDILDGLPESEILEDRSLKDLGANSIDRMEIITMSMEDLDLKIPLVDFAKVKNIGGLVEFFYEKI